ncbi:restriction endonuclease [Acinetobacter bereziniae]|uniref:restriction endonuclease n=1 Tax=Acinetobacter bereziniae TaxID=106648 RepID=UPI003214D774
MNKAESWIVSIFVKIIQSVSTEQDRLDILSWLALVREILENKSFSTLDKIQKIKEISHAGETVKIVMRSVATSLNNYKNADIPWSVKIAIPITLGAAAIVGGPGVGIAAFGGAIGMPLLVLVFLGTAGITSIFESFFTSKASQSYIGVVMALIVKDEVYRRANKQMQEAMISEASEPKMANVPKEVEKLKQYLWNMDNYAFEQHVMSFFQDKGMLSWVTKKSNDAGVDGFAKHENGLIVVQCKRHSVNNLVGRPVIQQFKGVIEENQAWRGYIVTTSNFTQEAKESALKNEKLILIGMDQLVEWHLNDGLEL